MRSQSPLVPLHPELFQIKCKRQEEQFRANVLFPPRKKSAESEVVFEQSKSALHLDRPAQAQMNTVFRSDVFQRGTSQFLQRFVYTQLLGLVGVLRLAALLPYRAARAAFAAVPCRRNKPSILQFCTFTAQVQRPALRTSILIPYPHNHWKLLSL